MKFVSCATITKGYNKRFTKTVQEYNEFNAVIIQNGYYLYEF